MTGARMALATVALLVLVSVAAVTGSPAAGSTTGTDRRDSAVVGLGGGGVGDVLHLKFSDDADVSLRAGRFVGSASGVALVNRLLDRAHVEVERLFRQPEQVIDQQRATLRSRGAPQLPDLNAWYRITSPTGATLDELRASLAAVDSIDDVYYEPTASPPPVTPDFVGLQGYRLPAPGGVGVTAVASYPGGSGSQVTVTDIEYSWNQSHEDLGLLGGELVPNGTPYDPFSSDDHGTGALGVIRGVDNGLGVTGIVPDAAIMLVNAANLEVGWDLANAVQLAATNLAPGDVMLLEQQVSGPQPMFDDFVPVEWVPAVYDAISLATASGIVVVEAAGNGAQDLDDDALFGDPFPLGKPDSGAIIVGAGAASGCGGADRSRLPFSTYGARVDLQGWGRCVATAGYGFLFDGGPNARYTADFSGTSSASAMVAAAAASLSSAYEAAHGLAPTPAWVRATLEATGSPQDISPGTLAGEIGPLPDLAQAFALIEPPPPSAPAVSIGHAAVVEGDTGLKRTISFPVTLSHPATETMTVKYKVEEDGSVSGASPGADFKTKTGTLKFKPSSSTGRSVTTKYVTATVQADAEVEGDETFRVVLSNPTGGFVLGSDTGIGTIIDDEPVLDQRVSIGDVSIWEGDVGQKSTSTNNPQLWVNLTTPAVTTVSVKVTVTAGSASQGSDFKKQSVRTVTFKPGQWQKPVTVRVIPDLDLEGDETFAVVLSAPTGDLMLGRWAATVTILDDE
jgi:serine protease